MKKVAIFWFRRDLRLEDNVGLTAALKSGYTILPIFIFDKQILDKLPKEDPRVDFIFETLQNMRQELREGFASSIAMYYDTPEKIFKLLLSEYDVAAVYTNRDYEPYAKERDEQIRNLLGKFNPEILNIKPTHIKERLGDVRYSLASIEKGKRYLGYKPSHTFCQGLEEAIDWYWNNLK